jgi:superfamily II DNA or RNA helicase
MINVPASLREEQAKVLQKLLNGRSCLAVLPTGFGKTMIMVLFPLLLDEVHSIFLNFTQTK